MTGQYTDFYFPSKGVRYIAINDNVDTLNGESELPPLLNILNEMHACQTSKKVKAALHTKFANGLHIGAACAIQIKKAICSLTQTLAGLWKKRDKNTT